MKYVQPALRSIVVLFCLAALAGCALTRPPAPVSILAPHVQITPDPDWPRVDWSLQIHRPIADQMRDSDRLLVRRSASRLQIYTGAAWLDQMPLMLQAAMIQTFEDTGHFGSIGRTGNFRTRYILATEVRHFEAVDDGGPELRVELAVQANLIHQRSARAVATHTFRREVAADDKTLDALINAFEIAMAGLLHDMAGWTLEQGETVGAEWETRFQRERGHRPR